MNFKHLWYLVDGDGFSLTLVYNPDFCIVYENRKSKVLCFEVIDPKNFAQEVTDFIEKVDREFDESLCSLQSRIISEIEKVILVHSTPLN